MTSLALIDPLARQQHRINFIHNYVNVLHAKKRCKQEQERAPLVQRIIRPISIRAALDNTHLGDWNTIRLIAFRVNLGQSDDDDVCCFVLNGR